MTYIREYCDKEKSEGRDDGGYYRMIKVKPIPANLQKRMIRCGGCHNNFYNNRANWCGNYCWSLDNYDNFRSKKSKPKCYH